MKTALALLIAASTNLATQGETILVDFGNDLSYRGASTPSPDGNGNYWNSVWSGAYYPGLTDKAVNRCNIYNAAGICSDSFLSKCTGQGNGGIKIDIH